MRKISTILALFMVFCGYAQVGPSKYFVGFTDKNGTPYSINQPLQFLTQRAVDRRTAQGIAVTELDLPVNPSYIQQVLNIGVGLINPTKWLNGVTILTSDQAKLTAIAALPFVATIIKADISPDPAGITNDKFAFEKSSIRPVNAVPYKSTVMTNSYNYGISYNQIHMVNGDYLHNLGYHGEGKVIAILDAGFYHVDQLPAFDSLWANNQILGTKDFAFHTTNLFSDSSHIHGMMVLSIIAGNIPGQLVGTGPKAKFWLLRSEIDPTENLIEEYNWVSAAEFADSVGADIISTSLGYTVFDDPSKSHTCADMNGHTTPCTIGANIAATRGIAVSCSAGNEGGNLSWRCVSAPADGDNVMAIGAVDSLGFYVGFSSVGVDTNGRVKPNVTAQGFETVIENWDGTVSRGSGTSFSNPLIAGMLACLWQAKPGTTNFELYEAMERSASQYNNPDSLLGYGIPNFQTALTYLGIPVRKQNQTGIFPNPFRNTLTVNYNSPASENLHLAVYNGVGDLLQEVTQKCQTGSNTININNLSSLSPGIYYLRINSNTVSDVQKIIKVR